MNINNTKWLILAIAINTSFLNGAVANEPDNLLQNTISSKDQSSDTKSLLMAKLANLNFFSANFSQEVLSESGELLEQSAGKLAISKPNLANWHTTEPDELVIVSDGKDVWFYNPWIEQVSVYSLSAAIAKTPILLLTSKDKSLWDQYNVTKTLQEAKLKNESFVISAKDINSQIKSLTLVFDKDGENNKLKQFSFLDATGQLSNIKLSDFDKNNKPEQGLFNFVVPEGVQIDDQREN
jgi:outer membrane lipoprotein carrier protein